MSGVIVLGIGHTMRGDDAVGIAVVEKWAEENPHLGNHALVKIAYEPLPGLALLDHISGYDVAILVDAVLGGPGVSPGSLLYLTPEDLSGFTRGTGSAHGWGVAETLELGRTLKQADMPEKVIILGIGGKQVEIGEDMSPEVAQVVPQAVSTLEQLVQTALMESDINRNEVS
ncbi:hydrogenase maturation protease [bacterium]|nr:hydrogenase maturation protease [bacterium]MCB2179380.1 hydrogenase maturation protease [bacterium]